MDGLLTHRVHTHNDTCPPSVLHLSTCLPVHLALRYLAGPVWSPRYLDEAVVKREVMTKGVLPPRRVSPVVGKPLLYELVDLVQGHHLIAARLDGHRGQRYVRVGRFLLVRSGGSRRTRHDQQLAA